MDKSANDRQLSKESTVRSRPAAVLEVARSASVKSLSNDRNVEVGGISATTPSMISYCDIARYAGPPCQDILNVGAT